jgi:ABC-type Fe3+-hydroxamate transport system substrate-binding protein
MGERALTTEIIRLQRLDLDEKLRQSVEEAAQLLADGRYSEAEALLQNTDARVRQARAVTGVLPAF